MNSLIKIYSLPSYKQKHKLEIKFKEKPDTFNLDLTDNKGVADCVIGHFGYNFYFRTPKGLKEQKYKNFLTMVRAIKRVSKNNGLTFESIGIKKYYKYRILKGV